MHLLPRCSYRRSIVLTCALAALASCTTVAIRDLDALFGKASPKEFEPVTTTAALEYERDIRPLMDRRCLVCHGCYDAPCQVKLDSYPAILRGGNKSAVYHSSRLAPDAPTRMFEDAQSTTAWRAMGFYPVLNERQNMREANLQAGVLARMLELKRRHPLPDGKVLPDTFDFSLGRKEQCPSIEEFDAFARKYPTWGMPYGLPSLSEPEHQKILNWVALGAPAAAPAPLTESLAREVAYWETLFNGETLKHRLAARYVYEHLFLAHVYLEDQGANTVFFKLVRSRTPPGQPLDIIATRRPYDDPGVARVYYRLWRDPESKVAKTLMPYELSPARRDRWRKWFIDTEYSVSELPGYDPDTASNPFVTFEPIPYWSRHSFMLDEAQFTIMNFIKGPVCRGNAALSVIQDRFWVFFTSPQLAVQSEFSTFLAKQDTHLKLPAEAESGLWSIAHWRSYAKAQGSYLSAKGDFIRANMKAFEQAGLKTFWNGDEVNPNAALTVFRHYDSATVLKGLVGEPPETAWLIDYPILERVHYLLVAGFDVYGTASHQAMTRLYMDFLRMESEMNFVAFLPQERRQAEIAHWYQGAQKDVQEYLDAYFSHEVLPPPYDYKTSHPKLELFQALQRHLGKVLDHRHDLSQSRLPAATITELKQLDQVRGIAASIVPQTTLISVKGSGLLTLLSNSAYTNISSMFNEADRRLPAEDSLTILNGVVGAYPNVFLQVELAEIPALVASIQQLRTEEDYVRLVDRFGVRRTDARFWSLSDQVHDEYRRSEPLTFGVLDYNRYENR